MAFTKGEEFWIHFSAFDTSEKSRKSGDAANMTAYIIADDASEQLANNDIEEVYDGNYKLKLNASETDTDLITVTVSSTTSDVYIAPVRIQSDISGSGIATDLLDESLSGHTTSGTIGEVFSLLRQNAVGKKVVTENSETSYTVEIYDTDDTTVLAELTIAVDTDTYTRTTDV